MKQVFGNSYPVREQLKALGGKWDASMKCWEVPDDKYAEALALVAEKYLRYGERWEPCYCGTEPVCNRCERCSRHCTC